MLTNISTTPALHRGAKGPRATPESPSLPLPSAILAEPDVRPYSEGEVIFGAMKPGYVLLLKSTRDLLIPATGQVVPGESKVARFRDGEFRTSDPETIEQIKRSSAFKDGTIYDKAEAQQQAKVAAKAQMIADMKEAVRDPEVASALRAVLTGGFTSAPVVKE